MQWGVVRRSNVCVFFRGVRNLPFAILPKMKYSRLLSLAGCHLRILFRLACKRFSDERLENKSNNCNNNNRNTKCVMMMMFVVRCTTRHSKRNMVALE